MRSRYDPVVLDPIRATEIDGRFIDVSKDLGPVDDHITSIDTVSVAIKRRDGFPMTSDDLALAGAFWPNTLDTSGLVVTLGLAPPGNAAGRKYQLTMTVNQTMQGRLFVRDAFIDVLAAMG